jgi:hypothetical protein
VTGAMLVGLLFWLTVAYLIGKGVKGVRRERALNRQAARNVEAWLAERDADG